jgi:hypothetical protein
VLMEEELEAWEYKESAMQTSGRLQKALFGGETPEMEMGGLNLGEKLSRIL